MFPQYRQDTIDLAIDNQGVFFLVSDTDDYYVIRIGHRALCYVYMSIQGVWIVAQHHNIPLTEKLPSKQEAFLYIVEILNEEDL